MSSPRERLAAGQAELVRALLAGGPAPLGFRADRLRVEADVLRRKRMRLFAFLRPDVPDALGDRYRELFEAFAAGHPKAVTTRAREDADNFATWLVERGELPKPWPRWLRRFLR
ncbi:hypothetical protein [Amycolatopsis sp. H20-H5]|uniref:hypothetical protein n=1 Tax=Amycolatopsis sp. H20-H5 TaxID=3046309 RepID=UPI002DB817D1|nr:hypothetical protein [Amycolatopsis sp. H20-H5]MEC3981570.1 hypothetical protein [Amycolatopsis sp. H20-H5]